MNGALEQLQFCKRVIRSILLYNIEMKGIPRASGTAFSNCILFTISFKKSLEEGNNGIPDSTEKIGIF